MGDAYNPAEYWGEGVTPDWLLWRESVPQGAKLCFGYLTRFAGKVGPTVPELAKALGVKERTAGDYLHLLRVCGLLETEQRGRAGGCRYTFLWTSWAEETMRETAELAPGEGESDEMETLQIPAEQQSLAAETPQEPAEFIPPPSPTPPSPTHTHGKATLSTPRGAAKAKSEAHPDTHRVYEEYLGAVGLKAEADPHKARNLAAAKWMLTRGYTAEQILRCVRWMSSKPYFKSVGRTVQLGFVKEDIFGWKQSGEPSAWDQNARPGVGAPEATTAKTDKWKQYV